MGEVLIAGTAALLICIFLSPRFIETLRNREFGQNIREEGPEGHHGKAGTPTMGGIIIFTAISIPFLILSDYDWRSVGVFGVAIAWWPSGPSSRMNWPNSRARRKAMNFGDRKMQMSSEAVPAMRTSPINRPPADPARRPRGRRRASP